MNKSHYCCGHPLISKVNTMNHPDLINSIAQMHLFPLPPVAVHTQTILLYLLVATSSCPFSYYNEHVLSESDITRRSQPISKTNARKQVLPVYATYFKMVQPRLHQRIPPLLDCHLYIVGKV